MFDFFSRLLPRILPLALNVVKSELSSKTDGHDQWASLKDTDSSVVRPARIATSHAALCQMDREQQQWSGTKRKRGPSMHKTVNIRDTKQTERNRLSTTLNESHNHHQSPSEYYFININIPINNRHGDSGVSVEFVRTISESNSGDWRDGSGVWSTHNNHPRGADRVPNRAKWYELYCSEQLKVGFESEADNSYGLRHRNRTNVSTIKLPLHSVFQSVTMRIADKLVTESKNLYPNRDLLETLVTY